MLSVALIIIPGCSEKHRQAEFRGVWLHPGVFSQNRDKAIVQMDSLFSIYQETGINNLFCYNAGPEEKGFGWDYLEALIKTGHAKGLKIHPVFYPGYDINPDEELARHPSWLIRDMDGKVRPHFNIANPEVRKYWVEKIKTVLKYNVDGIHLDYIRFPITQMYSYDSLTCDAFKKEYGYTPVEISHDCGSMIWCEWIKWNAKQVTRLVTDIRKAISETGKPVVLGADVFPDMETADVLIAQNWKYWASNGLVDFVCPMLYTNNPDLFRQYIRNAKSVAGSNCMVYPGIGVRTSHNVITKDLIVREVKITREEKTNGMVFFSGYSFNKEMRDTLRVSLF